jgi:hypothetical protein
MATGFTCAMCGGPVDSGGWCTGSCDPGRPNIPDENWARRPPADTGVQPGTSPAGDVPPE